MASSRACRIMQLLSIENKTIEARSEDEDETLKSNIDNVPSEKIRSQYSEMLQDKENLEESLDSCDDILSDYDSNIKYDHRLITSRKVQPSCKNKEHELKISQVSLVPAYDSDDSSEDNSYITRAATVTEIRQSLPKPNSPSSSSSSSSSSTSSSDSDSSLSSEGPKRCSPELTTNTNEYRIIDSQVIEQNRGTSSIETAQSDSSKMILRQQNFNTSNNISPMFTDESDIDLSDDDPSFDYEKLIHNKKKKNYIFESHTTESDSDGSSQININKKGRKRTRNPTKWKQNQIKKLRNTGESYVSTAKTHKTIPSRCLKIPCTEKCKLKCTENISTPDRYDLFKEFWDLGDLNKQRAYISTCMVDIVPKYKYTNAEKPRRPNKAYYFTVNNIKIRVCKTFFKSTLDITDRTIFTVQTRVSERGFMLEDMRGRHNKHRTLSSELTSDIRKHILSIPKMESHYVRASTSRQFIDGGKTIKDLYKDFVEDQKKDSKEFGNYIAYYTIFTKEFNLSFFQPKKDQCDLCLSYKNSVEEKKKELEEKFNTHLEEKALSRHEKQEDRRVINKNNKVVIYDLQAVLQCPRGDSSSFYYKSKLNSYNLTLTELTTATSKTAYDNVHCYFWTESDAKRGAVEIGTCVLKYLERLREEDTEEKNIIFYSDNCCGHNKNKYIATLYLFATQNFNINTITHKFLITGHTQNEADSVHSLIEKEIKKNLKSGPIYSPDQYIALIKNAKKSKPAINVHELTFESFMDMKLLQEEWGYNYNIDIEGQTVNWNNIKVLFMKKECPFSIFFKTSYKDNNYREINVRNKRKKMSILTQITLHKAYTQRQDISVNKKKDLKDLINKGLIPPFYTNFYNSIIN
ncbi:uncharacterized protein LOC113504908 [Trichoplusia ni]|uniref:Uncharacterized protein LOC113504908 n=1 Tax=Trichoplusia ni TaxID=7111 RepID=A0A7E5WR22_TRINI|nr:uncharacterized protein LOC113504908 [Trichoplusia ni]